MIDKAGVYDELELGQRAADWQFNEELGMLYTRVEDRAWAVIVGCYRKVMEGCPGEADRWYPQLDAEGMWVRRRHIS